MDRAARLALAAQIAARVRAAFAGHVLAVALYGSAARGEDGPFSDLEFLCIVAQDAVEHTYEWCAGPWKAEVNLVHLDALLAEARQVDGRWPLTHGAFLNLRPLWDPHGLCDRVADAVHAATADQFTSAIEGVLVGELYEFMGKVRNLRARGQRGNLTDLAVEMARHTAFVIGLASRTPFRSGLTLLDEALANPDRPEGFDPLCHAVLTGDLDEDAEVTEHCERLWSGLERWAALHGFTIVSPVLIPF